MNLLDYKQINIIHSQTFIETCYVPDIVLDSRYNDK